MSPSRARPRTLYLLIFANLIVLALSVFTLAWASRLAHRIDVNTAALDQAVDRSFKGCQRGNVLRRVARHALQELGDPESILLSHNAALKPQPCSVIYPGGKP